jgi:hypothetical protein
MLLFLFPGSPSVSHGAHDREYTNAHALHMHKFHWYILGGGILGDAVTGVPHKKLAVSATGYRPAKYLCVGWSLVSKL